MKQVHITTEALTQAINAQRAARFAGTTVNVGTIGRRHISRDAFLDVTNCPHQIADRPIVFRGNQ